MLCPRTFSEIYLVVDLYHLIISALDPLCPGGILGVGRVVLEGEGGLVGGLGLWNGRVLHNRGVNPDSYD